MNDQLLAERFEADRTRLLGVAYRLLGSASEADDAVQETWLRLSRADSGEIDNLSGWLTTVTARVCLDMLRSRKRRREEPLPADGGAVQDAVDPEREALLSESVGQAMLAVLQRLSPAERVAFVLHDVFAVPFEEIAGIVDRSPAATRKLASRARQRVQGEPEPGRETDAGRLRDVVEAFLRASRSGDFRALLAVLDPDVVLRPDETALRMGTRSGWLQSDLRGAEAVAKQFSGRAEAARLALVDGIPGAVWAPGGTPRVVFGFTIRDGKVAEITLAADPQRLGELEIEILT